MQVRTVHDLAAAVRGRRRELGLSQVELAAGIGVSRDWVSDFESGKATVEMGLVLRVLEALRLRIDLAGDTDTLDAAAVDLDAILDEHRRR
jgi:y4mF family transcriptional regulator